MHLTTLGAYILYELQSLLLHMTNVHGFQLRDHMSVLNYKKRPHVPCQEARLILSIAQIHIYIYTYTNPRKLILASGMILGRRHGS